MISPTPTDDPFLQVQREVLALLHTTRPLFASYQRIRSLSPSPTSPELSQARADLSAALADLATDIRDLRASVRVVEADPYRYGLELDEVARRRRLVEEVGAEMDAMRAELDRALGSLGGGGLPAPETFEAEAGEDGYGAWEQERQVEVLMEQEQMMDGVARTVGNLRMQAHEMGRELGEQAELLEGVDTLADRVGGKLETGVKRIGWVIRENEGMCLFPPL
ncbi:MAG: hypothetical protein M1829_006692 [Trizodia sp. TS-e1964]|nr:MAG: hypothetical protein M1829_006692 [Trizodia sp. TS-e1964]